MSAYVHINGEGQPVVGKIIRRPCTARIDIFSPLDHMDRRAIVILTGPHNHPRPPRTKLSRAGRDLYTAAATAAGSGGLTVTKCDTGTVFSDLDM